MAPLHLSTRIHSVTDSHSLLGDETWLVAPTLFNDALDDQFHPRADLYLRQIPRFMELVPKGSQRLWESLTFYGVPK